MAGNFNAGCISGENGCGDLGRWHCSRGWCGCLSSPTRDVAPSSQAYRIFFTTDTKCNLRFASMTQRHGFLVFVHPPDSVQQGSVCFPRSSPDLKLSLVCSASMHGFALFTPPVREPLAVFCTSRPDADAGCYTAGWPRPLLAEPTPCSGRFLPTNIPA